MPCVAVCSRLLFMSRRLILSLAFMVAALSSAPVSDTQEQSVTGSGAGHASVGLIKLHDPEYPPVAHMANVYGDVRLTVHVANDGSIQSVEFVSGPLLLKKAAVESAEESTFECRACNGTTTPYPMVYSFELTGGDCCTPGPVHVSRSGNHVWITTSQFCICDPGTMTRVRSIKCLYLWRCTWR